VSGGAQNGGRARGARLHLLIAAGALPWLVSCSSSSSVEYAADAFPSQSLADLLRDSKSSAPAAPNATPPSPSATSASAAPPASTAPPAREAPPPPATAGANPPPGTATSAESDDPVAAAFPSVTLIDIVTGRKSGSQ